MLRYSRQQIDGGDIAAVVAVLRSDWLTTGPAVERFEADLCDLTGAAHAVAFANGTAALHGAASAAGLGPGDIVATSALSFVASANCARYVGANPTFVDIDPETLNLDPTQVPDHVDALVAVHYGGLPVDLAALATDLPVLIEDAAHALGATTPDGPVGNCARSDLCCFSFHPVKPITTAEGGAVTTNSATLADRLRRFRNHGLEHRPEDGAWNYEVTSLGFNYRLTDLQAALGSNQLSKLERFTDVRHRIATRYRECLTDLPVRLPPVAPPGFSHAHHLFAIRVGDRRHVFDGLRSAGIGVQVHYVPIHHHPVMADLGPFSLPATDAAYEQLLSLPLRPDLSPADQDRVVEVLGGLL